MTKYLLIPDNATPNYTQADNTTVRVKQYADGTTIISPYPVVSTLAGLTPIAPTPEQAAAQQARIEAQLRRGITINGITLAADIEDQNRFTSLATMLQLQLANGGLSTDMTGWWDNAGVHHTATIADTLAMLSAYAQAIYDILTGRVQ